MLETFEKAIWILTGFVILITGVLFYIPGPPSDLPSLYVDPTKHASKSDFERTLSSEEKNKLAMTIEKVEKTKNPKGSSRGRRAREVATDYFTLQPADLEYYSNMNNAVREAKTIKYKIRENEDGTNAIELTELRKGSPLLKLGLQENDVVELIGSEAIDFTSTTEGKWLYDTTVRALKSGEFVVVNVSRNGRPHRIICHAGQL